MRLYMHVSVNENRENELLYREVQSLEAQMHMVVPIPF